MTERARMVLGTDLNVGLEGPGVQMSEGPPGNR